MKTDSSPSAASGTHFLTSQWQSFITCEPGILKPPANTSYSDSGSRIQKQHIFQRILIYFFKEL